MQISTPSLPELGPRRPQCSQAVTLLRLHLSAVEQVQCPWEESPGEEGSPCVSLLEMITALHSLLIGT